MGGSGTCRRQTKVVPHWPMQSHRVHTDSKPRAYYVHSFASISIGRSLSPRARHWPTAHGRRRRRIIPLAGPAS
jgi:hypothetical protein